MAELNKIKFKRTSEKGKKPTPEILESGELAINLADRYLFTKDDAGAVINLSNPPVYEGDVSFTGSVKGEKAILGKTADYQGDENQRDLSKFGAFRPNHLDGWDDLILNVPHSYASKDNYAYGRGFEFQYGHTGNKVYTYGFGKDGQKAFKFRMYHEGDKPSPSELNVYSKQESDAKFQKKNDINLALTSGGSTAKIEYVSNGEWRFVQSLDGQGNWTRYVFPNAVGTSLIASREWTNSMVVRTGADTYLRNSNNTKWLALTDDGSMSLFDNSAKKRIAYIHNGGSMTLWGAGNYTGLTFEKKDTYKVRMETDEHSGSGFLNVIYRNAQDQNQAVIRFPKENGMLATREWSDGRFVRGDITNLGKQRTSLSTIQSGQWAKPIGYSVMVNSNSPQRPPNTSMGYWYVMGARDMAQGYSGIWTEHGGGRMFYGRADAGTSNPTWYKIYTEAQKPTPAEIGAPSSTYYEATGGESRMWNGNKNHYLFINNNLNSGLYNSSGGKYVWGFNSTGQMTAGLVPVSCGGTGAKDVAGARNSLQVYSKTECDSKFATKASATGTKLGPLVTGNWIWIGDGSADVAQVTELFKMIPDNAVFCGCNKKHDGGWQAQPKWRVIQ
ncbi:hypothetical protein [Proteus columbae]|uniref:hypothetical protein n=1 Tax=Proteus columbae TaxID=1987580 RepID=UPI002889DDBD|nr:hypothetical protein [Proteus columbae]